MERILGVQENITELHNRELAGKESYPMVFDQHILCGGSCKTRKCLLSVVTKSSKDRVVGLSFFCGL